MTTPAQTVCSPWAEADDVGDCSTFGLQAGDVVDKLPAASDLLYRMSGYQWPGSCSATVRPACTQGDGGRVVVAMGGWDGGWWAPQGIAGTLAVNCLGGSSCGCLGMRQILLPGEPVTAVTEVKIDGEVLDSDVYRVDDWRYLVRIDGGTWPSCQQLYLDDTETGTWSVTFTYGTAPPSSGVNAAVALAVELAKGCCPDTATGDCALPADVVRASRRGLEFQLEPADLMTEGRTGIEAVDLFIQATNPYGLARGATVRSPDLQRSYRVAGT